MGKTQERWSGWTTWSSSVQCGATMKIIAFLTDYAVVDRIIDHLKLTLVAERPPPPRIAYQELLTAAESSAEYIS